MGVEITCKDTEMMTITDSQYLIVCGARRYVGGEQLYPAKGTAVVTIKTHGR